MNREELYKLIKEQQPNICQVAAYKAGEKVYSQSNEIEKLMKETGMIGG